MSIDTASVSIINRDQIGYMFEVFRQSGVVPAKITMRAEHAEALKATFEERGPITLAQLNEHVVSLEVDDCLDFGSIGFYDQSGIMIGHLRLG